MDGFETPYDDGVEVIFINCEICNKSIRGETLYKLHVTSPGHVKNEETLIAEGKVPRQQYLPVFEDIVQYLEYLNLDEPIIGLSYLFEIPDETSDTGIKYNCTLCKVHAYLTEAVQHVIGRKHRQKYLENNRPDLVNWDSQRPQTISGKIIRAKAEIAERQDGQGRPQPLPNETKRRFLPRISIQGGRTNGEGSSFTKDIGTTMPKFGNFSKDMGWQVSDDYMHENYQDNLANRVPPTDSDIFTEHYERDRNCSGYPGVGDYERKDSGDFSNVLGIQDQDRRQYGCSQREELYTDGFQKPPIQKDVLKEFYTEELRREQLAKAQKWSNDIVSHQHEPTWRSRELGSGVNQRNYLSSLDAKNPQEICKLIKDYRKDALNECPPHETLSYPGPSRLSPSRSGDFSRKMSNIPDPFMRFLKGELNHEGPKVKKRKSRFSDATAEELQTARKMFADEYRPPDHNFRSLRPAIKTNPLVDHTQTEAYQQGVVPQYSESTGDVFDMLKNIEIENEEEANFLKERLCSLLKEFKARKAGKTAQSASSRAVDSSNMGPVNRRHTQDHYGRKPRANLGIRRTEEPYDDPSQESYSDQMLNEPFHEHEHPRIPEPRYPTRKPYKEVKRWPNNQPQHAPGYDTPAPFPEMFQEPLWPQDYQSSDNFSDYHSSTSHFPTENEPRMNKPLQYSRNLDKITSTLLELVKRK